jgi:hypothetical protein
VPKPKGSVKTGGRTKGTANKATDSIKLLLNRILPEERLAREWEHHLKHKNEMIRYRTFELANAYLFGKPVMPIQGAEDAPPVHIDISAIPRKRQRA